MTATPSGADGSGSEHPPLAVSDLTYADAGAELDAIIDEFETGVVDVDRLVDRLQRATDIVDELDRRLIRTRMQVDELVPRLEGAGQNLLAGSTEEDDETLDEESDPPGLF